MFSFTTNHLHYIITIIVMMVGLYTTIAHSNLVKKIIGLMLFQQSVLFFFVSLGKVHGGTAPILSCLHFENCQQLYSNPLPHVLVLTAIVVGVATLAVALALILNIHDDYKTMDEHELLTKTESF